MHSCRCGVAIAVCIARKGAIGRPRDRHAGTSKCSPLSVQCPAADQGRGGIQGVHEHTGNQAHREAGTQATMHTGKQASRQKVHADVHSTDRGTHLVQYHPHGPHVRLKPGVWQGQSG